MKLATIGNSDAAKYLQKERIAYTSDSNLQEVLEKVGKGKLDAVLHSVPVLRDTINNDPDLSLRVQPVNIPPRFFALSFASESKLKEPVNKALSRVINSPVWQQQLDRFIPEKKR